MPYSSTKCLRLMLIAMGLLLLGPGPWSSQAAWAAEEASGEDSGTGNDGNGVALPTLIAPVVDGKRLVGYIYLSLRLTTGERRDADHLRDILPLVQDSLLRALNDAPLPADEAATPAAKDAVVKTVTAALGQLGDVHGISDIALTDFQNVPF